MCLGLTSTGSSSSIYSRAISGVMPRGALSVTVITATHDMKMLDAGDGAIWITDAQISRIHSRDELDIKAATIDARQE